MSGQIGGSDISSNTSRTGISVDDPYSIGPNEQTGTPFVGQVLLGSENYVTWKRSMEIALSGRSKLSFVLGKCPKPTDEALQAKWQRCNDIIMSWLLGSVSPTIVGEIIHAEDVMTAWDILKTSYAGSNLARKSALKKELSNLVQGNLSVTEYYQRLSILWQELDAIRASKTTASRDCENCKAHEIEKLEDKISQFIMGLNDEFGSVRTNVNSMRKVPKLSMVYGLALQEEISRKSSRGAIEQSALFGQNVPITQSGQYGRGQGQDNQDSQLRLSGNDKAGTGRERAQKLFCTYCHKTGHTRDRCYKLIGYPPHLKDKSGNYNNRSRQNVNCVMNEEELSKGISGLTLSEEQMRQIAAMVPVRGEKEERSESCAFMAGMADSQPNTLAKHCWLLDSGASCHFASHAHLLEGISRLKERCTVKLPNGFSLNVLYKGRSQLSNGIVLEDVLLVPEFKVNLISISKLSADSGCIVTLTKNNFVIQDRLMKTVLLTGSNVNGLYCFQTKKEDSGLHEAFAVEMENSSIVELWHQRLGHPSANVLSLLLKDHVNDASFNSCKYDCVICPVAKQTKLPFGLRNHNAASPFELIHADVWGPSRTATLNGAKYFLTLVDDHTRAVWVFLLVQKCDVADTVIKFMNMIKTQFERRVKIFRSDNGTEFVNGKLQNFFTEEGCQHQTTCPYTPQQNGVVERKHRHIIETARALMFQAGLPKHFWGDSVLTSVYIINRLPSKVLKGKSPLEMLFGRKPDIQHLKVFGCLCFASSTDPAKEKFDPRATECIFVGYPSGKKGYKLFELSSQRTLVSRNVKFMENKFPYKNVQQSQDNGAKVNPFSPEPEWNFSGSDMVAEDVSQPEQLDIHITAPDSPPHSSDVNRTDSGHSDEISAGEQSAEQLPSEIPPQVRKSTRPTRAPARLNDFIWGAGTKYTSPHSLDKTLAYTNCSKAHLHYALQLSSLKEPATYNQAKDDIKWVEAMKKEIQALEENKTWILTELPKEKTLVDCKWVYKIKLLSDGTVERYKARLVARGFTQIEGLDYEETFAPVAKMTTVRCLLAIAAVRKWPIFQLDVNNAFLHGIIHEEVYMKLPPGFYNSEKANGKVCRLLKSIYGLKQAPRQWFARFSEALLEFGFNQSANDHSLFTLHSHGDFILLLVYVDDVLLTGTSEDLIVKVKNYIHAKFKIKDLGNLKYFLGLETARSATGIFLHQRKYSLDLLDEYHMTECKPVKTPIDIKHNLSMSTAPPMTDIALYRRLVGKLVYLTTSRPDLSYAVHILSQFLQAPTTDHFQAALRVLRYIKGAPAQGILFSANSTFQLQGFSDSDWASCPLSRKSITGQCVMLGSNLISWKSKRQDVVSRSTAEAEYRAMASVCSELVWLQRLLSDMAVQVPLPIPLYCDNKSAIYIAKNPVFHERTKHIEIDLHWIRSHIVAKFISPQHILGIEQPADMFTKPLPHDRLLLLSSKLGVSNSLHAPFD